MSGLSEYLKEGSKHLSGLEEAILRNITATKKLSDMTRTSLGPNGMNKMIVNHLEKLFVTSDAATIMKELDVVHPAAKVIVLNAGQQESEIGDATNLVVIFAGELLQKAESLLRKGLHPSEVVDGYAKSLTRALEILDDLCALTVTDVKDATLVVQVIRSAIGSKQHGYEDILAPLVAQACIRALPSNPVAFNVDNVRVVKVPGGSVADATLVQGMVLTRGAEGTVKHCMNAKIAVYAGAIDTAKTETKGTVLISNAEELLAFSSGEEKQMEKLVDDIAAAGVGVVVAGGNVGELAMHYLERKGIMVLKAPSKFELRRLCSAIGAAPLVRMGAPTPDEMGHCRVVSCGEIGGTSVTYFRNDDGSSKIATIVVRGATVNLLENVERAIDDGVNIFKLLCRDGRCVPGGGAAEIELARRLAREAGLAPGLAQYAMQRFAESLEVVAATLAETCGIDATKLVSDLYAAHEAPAPKTPSANGVGQPSSVGIDVDAAALADMAALNVWDHLLAKRNAIQLAVDAALTILKVDQIIMARRAGGPKAPQQGQRDADD